MLLTEFDELNRNLNALEKMMETLPEKALNLGIRVLLSALLFFIGMKLIKFIRKLLRKSLEHAKADLGVMQFLDALVKFGLYALLVLMIASGFGLDAASIVAVLGSVGVTIGLAVQGSLSNLAGGVLILLLKPFRVGDYIIEDCSKNEGTVKEIGIFYTKLQTVDNRVVVLPNGNLANHSLTNFSQEPLRRIDLTVGIAYNSNLTKAKELLRQILAEDADVRKEEKTFIFVDSLGGSEVVLGIRCYCENAKYWEVRWRLLERIKLTFDAEGIEIPFQQIDVHLNQK